VTRVAIVDQLKFDFCGEVSLEMGEERSRRWVAPCAGASVCPLRSWTIWLTRAGWSTGDARGGRLLFTPINALEADHGILNQIWSLIDNTG
jgi:hypothetical protein